MRQYATFYIDNYCFGMDVLLVREVNQNVDITPVDGASDYVRGLLNLRGLIITVLDLGVRLGLEKRVVTDDTRTIVLKTSAELERIRASGTEVADTCGDMIGLLVDRIGDMVSVDEKEMESPPANVGGIDGRFLDGVVKMEDQLLITLRIGELLVSDAA